MSEPTILLGYELRTGRAVHIPARHMAVTGITQMSGKTTTLEALIHRSGLRAVTFITKAGEASFTTTAGRLPAYFRAAVDWQTVTALLEAYLGETIPQSQRPHLMRACAGLATEGDERAKPPIEPAPAAPAKTLAEVAANLERMEAEVGTKGEARACYVLLQYFAGLLPELDKLPRAATLTLAPGLNIMDLSGYSVALQSLVIASTLDHIAANEAGVITLIPEAWEFIPREGNTPCKDAVIRMARKGACRGNFIWLDSQDLAGVDIEVRKMLSVYLLGVQREANEVRRTLKHIPADRRRPSESQIMQLERGWFYASYDRELFCAYVQPPWLDAEPERAREFAQYVRPASFVQPARPTPTLLKMKFPRESRRKRKTTTAPAAAAEPRTERVQ